MDNSLKLEANAEFPGLPVQFSTDEGATWSDYKIDQMAEEGIKYMWITRYSVQFTFIIIYNNLHSLFEHLSYNFQLWIISFKRFSVFWFHSYIVWTALVCNPEAAFI